MSTLEERYPPSADSGPKHSTIEITAEEKTHIERIVTSFMHAEEHVRDAVLNMLKLLPHIPDYQRLGHLESAFAILSSFGLRPERDILDDHFAAGVRVTATYLNLDPDYFEAIARRGYLAAFN